MRWRRNFTLRDLFVLVAVVSVLFSMLSPAISAIREAARRNLCSRRLEKIGIALHSYHSIHQRLPAAMFGHDANQHRLSGLILLTPFLTENDSIWETIRSPKTYGGVTFPAMGPAPWDSRYEPWRTELPEFRCPADPAIGPLLSRTNYAFCVGDQVNGLYHCTSKDDFRGCFAPGIGIRFRDIFDGLSWTLLMLEIGTRHKRHFQGQFAVNQSAELADVPSLCISTTSSMRPGFYSNSAALSALGRGGSFADGSGGFSFAHTILPPNSPSCAIGNQEPYSGVFSAGSYHYGGCHTLWGDGSVLFLTNTIECGEASAKSPATVLRAGRVSPFGLWGAFGTRSGGELVK